VKFASFTEAEEQIKKLSGKFAIPGAQGNLPLDMKISKGELEKLGILKADKDFCKRLLIGNVPKDATEVK
jgi:hypothetical protein